MSRAPIIIGAVAIVLVIAIGFLAYRALYGGARHESVAAVEPAKSSEPPKPIETPNASAKVESAVATPAPVQETAAPVTTTQSPPMDESPKSAAASQPRPDGSSAKAPRSTQSKAGAKADTPGAEAAPTAPAPPAKPAPKSTVAAAPAAVAVQRNHWEQYEDAIALCKREDFFKRIGCELSTRNKYCQGYWGQVPQCPEATPRDRGQ